MTVSGWILLIGLWGIILWLAIFCFKRIFVKKELK